MRWFGQGEEFGTYDSQLDENVMARINGWATEVDASEVAHPWSNSRGI